MQKRIWAPAGMLTPDQLNQLDEITISPHMLEQPSSFNEDVIITPTPQWQHESLKMGIPVFYYNPKQPVLDENGNPNIELVTPIADREDGLYRFRWYNLNGEPGGLVASYNGISIDAIIDATSSVGVGCCIVNGVVIKNSTIHNGVEIKKAARVTNAYVRNSAIIGKGAIVSGDIWDSAIIGDGAVIDLPAITAGTYIPPGVHMTPGTICMPADPIVLGSGPSATRWRDLYLVFNYQDIHQQIPNIDRARLYTRLLPNDSPAGLSILGMADMMYAVLKHRPSNVKHSRIEIVKALEDAVTMHMLENCAQCLTSMEK